MISAYDIIEYFASKNMGSKYLQIVDVIWETLDEIEKQMVSSINMSKQCSALSIRSRLPQRELNESVENTPYITL